MAQPPPGYPVPDKGYPYPPQALAGYGQSPYAQQAYPARAGGEPAYAVMGGPQYQQQQQQPAYEMAYSPYVAAPAAAYAPAGYPPPQNGFGYGPPQAAYMGAAGAAPMYQAPGQMVMSPQQQQQPGGGAAAPCCACFAGIFACCAACCVLDSCCDLIFGEW